MNRTSSPASARPVRLKAPPAARLPVDGGFGRLLSRNTAGATGLALVAVAAAIAAALATWSVADPSFSHATPARPVNALGRPGAILADILTQTLGLAAAAGLVPLVVWGWRLLTGQPFGVLRQRLGGLAVTLLGVAGFLAVFPVPAGWPLPIGLGGVIGDFALKLPEALVPGEAAERLVGGLLYGGLAVFGLIAVLRRAADAAAEAAPAAPGRGAPALDDEEDDDDMPGASLLGMAQHWWYAARARAGQLLGRRAARAATFGEGFKGRFGRLVGAPDEDDGLDAFRAAPVARRPAPAFADDEPGEAPQPAATARRPIPPPPLPDDEDDEPPFAADTRPIAGPMARPAAPGLADAKRIAVDPAPKPLAPSKRGAIEAQVKLPFAEPKGFKLPALALLAEPKRLGPDQGLSPEMLEENARDLEGVLEDFGVKGEILHARPGPVVTLYELEPAPGIKSSRVIGLADDIARSMSAISARVAVIPGKNAIGIELPNQRRETVYLRELLASQDFEGTKQKLALALGKTIGGEPVIADLARMPHLLVAGTTGSGKSVAINTMILSLLYRLTPEQCRLIMVDPKMLELSVYDGIPHLLSPVVTDPKKAVVALKWTVREMEDRYRKMSKLGVRNIDGFNARVTEAKEKGESLNRLIQTGFDRDTGEPIYEQEELALEPLPYIVVIVDEMADLMMVAGKDIEGAIQRLAQMARAAGIHVVLATQRPSVDVITGTIKANFPTRISFQVTSKIDSRTILGEQGAEQLLGQGDMLYMAGGGRIQRVHGPFVSDGEVEKIVAHLKTQGAPQYLDAVTRDEDEGGEGDEDGGSMAAGLDAMDESGDLYDKAVSIVLRDKKASTSYIQRRLQIGYNRAASLIERMQKEGIVGPANHAGKRDILVGGGVDGGGGDPMDDY